VPRDRSSLRTLTGKSPELIFIEAASIRKSLLGLTNLSDYERPTVWSVAKSLEDDVNSVRKEKPFDSTRLAALEERINYLKRSCPERMESLSGDENGKGLVEASKPVSKAANASQDANQVFDERSKYKSESDGDNAVSEEEEAKFGEDEDESGEEEEENVQGNAEDPSSQPPVQAWEESSRESLLQIQLLSALKNFVTALGYQSPICYNMLLPILRSGIDVNSPDEVMEDGMLVATNIMEGYIILGGTDFLSLHSSCVASPLDLVVGNVKGRGLLSILPVIEILIQVIVWDLQLQLLKLHSIQELGWEVHIRRNVLILRE
ncbi:hypothetical protein U1Q18_029409, partial [Sarracenia purpurea var. burkii]